MSVCSLSVAEPAPGQRISNKLHSRLEAKLFHGPSFIGFNSFHADFEFGGDGFIAVTCRSQLNNVNFPFAEICVRACAGDPLHFGAPTENLARNRWIEINAAGCDD